MDYLNNSEIYHSDKNFLKLKNYTLKICMCLHLSDVSYGHKDSESKLFTVKYRQEQNRHLSKGITFNINYKRKVTYTYNE